MRMLVLAHTALLAVRLEQRTAYAGDEERPIAEFSVILIAEE